jgi:predicted nucleic acid-binding protein
MSDAWLAELSGCVVDASVAIKLFVLEEGSDAALALFERLAADPPASFYVPDLFYAECANILWKYTRNYGYPAENARLDLLDLQGLALQSVSSMELIEPALELALMFDIPMYDACYLALAQMLEIPLVTADAALARKLIQSSITILLLTEPGS